MPLMSRRAFACAGLATAAGCLLSACAGGDQNAPAATTSAAASPATSSAPDAPYAKGIHHATISVESFGDIQLELNATIAPVTVANFAQLAEEKFYDGLTFHRIVKGFVIQGGDPTGTGRGGSSKSIVGEFEANGHANTISHTRGTISMARSQDYDSASSQFFICVADAPNLDGSYAAFGHVTSGMEVVDAIVDAAKPQDSNGTIAPEDQPRISSVRMVD